MLSQAGISVLLPALFLAAMGYAIHKRVKPYDSFVRGVKGAPPLLLSLFPYLAAMLILTELCAASGLTDWLVARLSPVCGALGIPSEAVPLLLVKPFSGSGSTAVLTELLAKYGADSYIARCACVCYGSSETTFYIASVYFGGLRVRTGKPIALTLLIYLLTAILGCALCRVL